MAIEEKIRVFLKSTLKERKISYAELAAATASSESSVKRLFTKKKITLSQFEVICNYLGISTLDGLLAAFSGEQELQSLTRAQEEFLVSNPLTDYIYLRLMIGFSPSQIQNELSLTLPQLTKHLVQLDRHGLIRLGYKDQVRVRKRGPFRWIKNGPFELNFRESFFRLLCRRLEKIEQGNGVSFASELYLSEASFQNLQKEMEELISKYKRITRLEQLSLPTSKLSPAGLLMGAVKVNAWKELLLAKVRDIRNG